MIPTIRGVQLTSRYKTITKGMYVLSKFRFKLSVVHKHRPEEVSTHAHVSSPSDNWGRESQIPHFILVSNSRLSGFVFVQNRLEFYLDPDADHYGNILEMAEGFWYIDDKPTDR